MGEEEKAPVSLREAIEQGFARTDPLTTAQMAAENNGLGEAAPAGAQTEGTVQAEQDPATAQQAAEQDPPAAVPAPATENPVQIPGAEPDPQNNQADLMRYLMAELNAQRQQNAQLAAQLQQAQGTVQEQSQAAQNAVDMATSQPTITVPILDINELQYDDDETRHQKLRAWQSAMAAQIKDEVAAQYAGQLQPLIEEQRRNERIAADAAAKARVQADARFADFKDRDEQIGKILGSTHEFDSMDAERRYLLGGLIARGLNYNAKPSAEEIVAMVKASPDAQRMLDSERARTIADRNAQIPTIQPSSGLSTANAIPDESPKTKEDLFRRTEAMLRR